MLVRDNAQQGLPVMRPLFLHYEEDEKCYDIKYQYLLGADVLVAPVYQEQQQEWAVYLPDDEWIHLWTGQSFSGGGEILIDAPIGKPPVFYRAKSQWQKLFADIKKI
jgi:alpha-glucosidase